jgi:two-component system, OmpR family, phosphate regulon sensor histidine kinase PhoR
MIKLKNITILCRNLMYLIEYNIKSIGNDGDFMRIDMQLKKNRFKIKRDEDIPREYIEELIRQLFHTNLKREIMLSFALLTVVIFLLGLDFIASNGWSQDVHIFGRFGYMHILLLLIPSVFLSIVYTRRDKLNLNLNLCKALHWSINSLVLILCSFISIYNGTIDRLPHPYIIAMFCIGSVVLLEKKERFAIYIFSYIIYVIGCIIIRVDIYELIGRIFFITLLVVLALVVSQIHYSSYVKDFINHKIILDKNRELDGLYRDTEQALKQRTEELNETVEYEKLRIAFFTNISHELRTPLTVIFSAEQMLDLFMKKEDFENRKEDIWQYMKVIRQNCYRLIRLVANLIDITKIDAGYFHIDFKNCEIIKVVEDITLSVARYIEDRDINLIFDTGVEEMTLACDPDKIERIMLNLLSNAVKFTPKGGSIYVNIFEKDELLAIHVKDTGIGIPENMKLSIFERFVQVDKTTSRNHEGSGIGLSIVKSLVNLHNGTIRVNSEEGKGSEFIIELPKKILPSENKMREYNFVNEKQNVESISIEFSDIYD